MQDYSYPSVYLSYLMFFLVLGLSIFFCIRSGKDGYWGKNSEDPKHRMMDEES
jgi:hypothetical protein